MTTEADFKNYTIGMEIIEAAGGMVLNTQGDVLMIYRRGFWDLPKGKIDPGESTETCAIREVQEEDKAF
jgi:8-oxo-dGTP pyrophosphatase MutT (NUDIX family)